MQPPKVGNTYPITLPSENFVTQIVDKSFHVIVCAGEIPDHEVRQFTNNPLLYGTTTFVDRRPPVVESISQMVIDRNVKVPFFLVHILDLDWQFGGAFNLLKEPQERRDSFLNDTTANLIVLVLCDYPTPRIRAVRGVKIRPDTMREIKDSCRHQVDSHMTHEDIDKAITSARAQLTWDQMIQQADMIKF